MSAGPSSNGPSRNGRSTAGPSRDVERRLAEWRGIAQGPRTAGMAIAALGVVAAIVRGTVMPGLPRLVPVILIVLALGLLGIGIVRRIRYHLRHRAGG